MKIFHNPRCAKSRETLALITEHKIEPEIFLYLESKLTQKYLKEVISMLGITPFDLIRRSEKIFKESFKGKDLSDKDWIKAMVENPKLIERPIVIKDKKAVLGRPPSNVLNLI